MTEEDMSKAEREQKLGLLYNQPSVNAKVMFLKEIKSAYLVNTGMIFKKAKQP